MIALSLLMKLTHLNKETDTNSKIEGDGKDLFEMLFKSFYKPLCIFSNNLVKDRSAAEDIVQEVFLKIWNKREDLDPSRSIKSYLFRATYNHTLNYLEKEKQHFNLTDYTDVTKEPNSPHADEDIQLKEMEAEVRKAIDHLPVKCRAVFLMCREQEMTYKEVAEAMNISVKTVENQMGKALKTLREKLAPYMDYLPIWVILMVD